MPDDDAPKLHIDSDWKAEAQREKEKLAESDKQAEAEGATGAGGGPGAAGPGQRGLPPANFETLVSTMATQTLLALGGFPDPNTGQRMLSLELARHHIDMLSVIEEKTKGNLSEEEQNLLTGSLYELRQRYVQMSNAARQRQ